MMRIFRNPCFVLPVTLLFFTTIGACPEARSQAQQAGDQTKSDSSPKKNSEKSKDTDKPPQSPTPATAPAKNSGNAPGNVAPSSKPAKTQAPASVTPTVWVNTDSGVYHKPGSRYYGKTKKGKYMTEADARKAGYREAKKE
jgi:cytoskeletal protein RodZ